MTPPVILCLNTGSSSVKFSLYDMGESGEKRLANGAIEQIGLPNGHIWVRDTQGTVYAQTLDHTLDHHAAVRQALVLLDQQQLPSPVAVGHRVVHGGPDYVAPELVTRQLLETLARLVAFAPLHQPSAILGIEAVAGHFPNLPQVACFDTAFHRRMPEIAQRFALPRALWEQGVRRYGFHGLSYEYITMRLGAAGGRTIMAHLGNGASLAALRDGQPLDTTMGLTPTGGVMMGTRSGDLDPGILLHLLNAHRYTVAQLEQLVNQEAGLLGVSGRSADMQTLLRTRAHDRAAAQAVDLFCYQVRKQIGALTAVMGGLDTLVFTGGIGEHAASIRWEVCAPLAYLGIQLDPQRNAAHAEVISLAETACAVRVIPTDENLMIARHTQALVFTRTTKRAGV